MLSITVAKKGVNHFIEVFCRISKLANIFSCIIYWKTWYKLVKKYMAKYVQPKLTD